MEIYNYKYINMSNQLIQFLLSQKCYLYIQVKIPNYIYACNYFQLNNNKI